MGLSIKYSSYDYLILFKHIKKLLFKEKFANGIKICYHKFKENIVILVWNEKSIGYIFLILFLGGLTINIEIQGRDSGGKYYFYEWYEKRGDSWYFRAGKEDWGVFGRKEVEVSAWKDYFDFIFWAEYTY